MRRRDARDGELDVAGIGLAIKAGRTLVRAGAALEAGWTAGAATSAGVTYLARGRLGFVGFRQSAAGSAVASATGNSINAVSMAQAQGSGNGSAQLWAAGEALPFGIGSVVSIGHAVVTCAEYLRN